MNWKSSLSVVTCFNTQPPEGGWYVKLMALILLASFNTQPPEGGWFAKLSKSSLNDVSTHSRPKAAGSVHLVRLLVMRFQHTAARRRLENRDCGRAG